MKWIALSLLLLFSAQGPAVQRSAAQGPALPKAVVFFSPNTTEGLSDADAASAMHSFTQENAIGVADRIVCALTPSAQVDGALGIFDKSAENSAVVAAPLDAKAAEYLAVMLARYEHQAWAFWFVASAAGRDRLWHLRTRAPHAEIARQLRDLGLAPATVIPAAIGATVMIVASESASAKVARLASVLKASVASEPGTTGKVGSDLPGWLAGAQAAEKEYDRVITAYERERRPALSASLWTAAWHDATERTCSASQKK